MTTLAPGTSIVPYLTSAAGAQDGSSVAGGWNDVLDGLTLSLAPPTTSFVGLTFDFGLRFSAMGTPLDPPIVSAGQLVLTTHPSVVADPGTSILEVWGVPETNPDLYSLAEAPFTRSEILVAAANYVWSGVGTQVTFNLGTYLTAGNANTPACAANFELGRMLGTGSNFWNGRVSLSLRSLTPGLVFTFCSAETAGANAPQLRVTQTNFFSGLIGGPTGPRQRIVRDQRFAFPALNTEVVQDGVVGMWVRPDDRDPEDLPATYRPKPGEGSIDDDIPTL